MQSENVLFPDRFLPRSPYGPGRECGSRAVEAAAERGARRAISVRLRLNELRPVDSSEMEAALTDALARRDFEGMPREPESRTGGA